MVPPAHREPRIIENVPRGLGTPSIDRFVLARLEKDGLSPAPRGRPGRTDPPPQLRPHRPASVARGGRGFAHDARADAYERLVDRLLASPRYGERWARLWLDAVRFGESNGYETNTLRKTAWPYRDWVIRAFNRDLPFSRFVAEQFAGDILPDGDWLTRSATGFLVGGVHDVVGNQTPEGMRQQRVDDLDDMITATGSAFLGLTVHCARCHDHKFDPIKQEDYYSLQAIFAGVDHAERAPSPPPTRAERRRRRPALEAELAKVELEIDASEPIAGAGPTARGGVRSISPATSSGSRPRPPRLVRFTVKATNNGSEPCIDELEVFTAGESPKDVALASAGASVRVSSLYPGDKNHAIEHLNDGTYGNSRSWISREPARAGSRLPWRSRRGSSGSPGAAIARAQYRDRLPVAYTVEVATEPGEAVAGRGDLGGPRRPGHDRGHPLAPGSRSSWPAATTFARSRRRKRSTSMPAPSVPRGIDPDPEPRRPHAARRRSISLGAWSAYDPAAETRPRHAGGRAASGPGPLDRRSRESRSRLA